MISTEIPLDYAVIGFPGNQFSGEIAPELRRLVEQGLIRIVDLVFITRDPEGNVATIELNDLPEDLYRHFIPFGEHLAPLFTTEDVEAAAQSVPADCSALFVLWQNVWTENFRRAVKNSNGLLLVHERIPAEVLEEVVEEIATAQS